MQEDGTVIQDADETRDAVAFISDYIQQDALRYDRSL